MPFSNLKVIIISVLVLWVICDTPPTALLFRRPLIYDFKLEIEAARGADRQQSHLGFSVLWHTQ